MTRCDLCCHCLCSLVLPGLPDWCQLCYFFGSFWHLENSFGTRLLFEMLACWHLSSLWWLFDGNVFRPNVERSQSVPMKYCAKYHNLDIIQSYYLRALLHSLTLSADICNACLMMAADSVSFCRYVAGFGLLLGCKWGVENALVWVERCSHYDACTANMYAAWYDVRVRCSLHAARACRFQHVWNSAPVRCT